MRSGLLPMPSAIILNVWLLTFAVMLFSLAQYKCQCNKIYDLIYTNQQQDAIPQTGRLTEMDLHLFLDFWQCDRGINHLPSDSSDTVFSKGWVGPIFVLNFQRGPFCDLKMNFSDACISLKWWERHSTNRLQRYLMHDRVTIKNAKIRAESLFIV